MSRSVALFVILFAIFVVVRGLTAPAGATLLTSPNGVQYVYFPSTMAMNHNDAAASCAAIGGSLAAVSSTNEFSFLAQKVLAPSWIKSWEGNDYNSCIAFYPGGAIAIPVGSCQSNHAFLCQ